MKAPRKRKMSGSSSDEESQTETCLTPPKRAGWILQMTLKNFMCHSHLEVNFNENINFVSGSNGSGKSALLAALSLGLGCKARTTKRGNCTNLKAFVKFGTPSASIEIILSNEGPKAFNPDKFGKKICIQRVLTASGASRYKIKDSTGKLVSTKADDVHEIINGLNIQVENPVCILSQDTARTFLNSADPKVLFDLFYRATRLDHMNYLLDDAIKKQHLARNTFKEKQEEELTLKQKLSSLQRKIEEARKVDVMHQELKQNETELAWCKALMHEKKFEHQKTLVDTCSATLETDEDAYKELKEKLETQHKDKSQLELKIHNFKTNTTNNKEIEDATAKLRTMEKEITDKLIVMSSLERQIGFKKSDLERTNVMIKRYYERAQKVEEEKEKRISDLKNYETMKNDQQALWQTYEDEIQKMNGNVREKENRVQSLHHELTSMTHKIKNLNDRLLTLQSESSNPYAIYGPHMIRVINAIKVDEQNFSRLPIGPIGVHVSIKDKKWKIAVESRLTAQLLRSFIVNSLEDQRRLTALLNRVWPKDNTGDKQPAIIATEFVDRLYDISTNIVARHPHCERLIDVLSVPNPIVMNCLIDQARIENILLIPDTAFGLKILQDKRTVPANCIIALTPQGDEVHPDPKFKMYSGRLRVAKYIQIDCADAARQCRISIDAEKRNKNELQTAFQQAQDDFNTASACLPRLRQQADKCRAEVDSLKIRIRQRQSTPLEVVGDVDALKSEAIELEKLIKTKGFTLAEHTLQVEAMKSQVEHSKEELNEHDSREREQCRAKDSLLREQDELETGISTTKSRVARAKQKFAQSKELLANETREMCALQRSWETIVVDTHREWGPRPQNLRMQTEIDAQINSIRRMLSRAAKADVEKLEFDLQKIEACVEKNASVMIECAAVLDELAAAKSGRKMKLLKTKKFVKDFAIFNFRNFLKCRNYQGNMAIDYDSKTLEMTVIPHTGSKGITRTANLSGGERSFATVALLYALWKCLDFPFYILDEFDVFMDTQNRQLAIKILIDHAKMKKDNQYIFLTPQDITFIKDKEVSLLKLEDPRKNT